MPSQVNTDGIPPPNTTHTADGFLPSTRRILHSRVRPKCFFESRTSPGTYFNIWPCDDQKDSKAIYLRNLLRHTIVRGFRFCSPRSFFPARTTFKALEKTEENPRDRAGVPDEHAAPSPRTRYRTHSSRSPVTASPHHPQHTSTPHPHGGPQPTSLPFLPGRKGPSLHLPRPR